MQHWLILPGLFPDTVVVFNWQNRALRQGHSWRIRDYSSGKKAEEKHRNNGRFNLTYDQILGQATYLDEPLVKGGVDNPDWVTKTKELNQKYAHLLAPREAPAPAEGLPGGDRPEPPANPRSDMGDGYGSKCHLLRYLGRHRRVLDAAVLSTFDIEGTVEWLDFPFDPSAGWPDAEWKGLDFLRHDPELAGGWAHIDQSWTTFWPQGAGIHNWDAVGWIRHGRGRELLLVEAKANLNEMKSRCTAQAHGGRPQIEAAFSDVKQALGVPQDHDWMNTYYQAANRIAAWHFLTCQLDPPIPARLLFLYFTGDRSAGGRICPPNEAGWSAALAAQDQHLGKEQLPKFAQERVRRMFLPVSGPRGSIYPWGDPAAHGA